MEQNAFDLFILFGGFLAVAALPVTIGIIAVVRQKAD